MKIQNAELNGILEKFAGCGWDLVDGVSRAWLGNDSPSDEETESLIAVIEAADGECGSCGCEFDPLYKRALEILRAG